jgi:DNA processing protein
LVSEAGARSGALITAERAIEMKKPVFGLVGRADNKQSEGIHRWIRKGLARLITSTEDILEEMEMLSSMPSQINMLEDASLFLAEQKKQSTMQRKSSEKKDVEKNNSSNQTTTQSNTKSIDIASLNESEKNIYSTLLEADSISMDRLVELTSMPIHKINSTLMTLELKKIIKRQGPSICRA